MHILKNRTVAFVGGFVAGIGIGGAFPEAYPLILLLAVGVFFVVRFYSREV